MSLTRFQTICAIITGGSAIRWFNNQQSSIYNPMSARKPTKTTQRPAAKTRRAAPPVRGGSASRRTGTTKGKSPAAPARPAPRRPSLWSSLSLDRKLDLLGVGMTLVGLLTLLRLLSHHRGWISAGWLALLGQAFGWGMYLLPVGLIALGLWLG